MENSWILLGWKLIIPFSVPKYNLSLSVFKEGYGGEVETVVVSHEVVNTKLNYQKYIPVSIRDYQSYGLLGIPYPMWCEGIVDGKPWSAVAETLHPTIDTALESAEELQIIIESSQD